MMVLFYMIFFILALEDAQSQTVSTLSLLGFLITASLFLSPSSFQYALIVMIILQLLDILSPNRLAWADRLILSVLAGLLQTQDFAVLTLIATVLHGRSLQKQPLLPKLFLAYIIVMIKNFPRG